MSKLVNPPQPARAHDGAMGEIEVDCGPKGLGEHSDRFSTQPVFDCDPEYALKGSVLKIERAFLRCKSQGRIALSDTKPSEAVFAGVGVPQYFSHPPVLEILPACNGSLGNEEKVEVKLAGRAARRDFGAAALRGVI